ncbi:MAG TPA: hypothetical protein ENJ01_12285 [Gammaproteobacteria bacterium]|nr:hypothetical protein [Gammaproteobacteria bacterium]
MAANTHMQRLADFFEQLPDWLRAHRLRVWFIMLLGIALLLPGISRFELDFSDEQFFQQHDPVRRAYDAFRAQFGGDESIYIVYRPKDGDVFSDQSLRAVRGIQEDILNYRLELEPGTWSPLDHIVDVTTIVNVSYLEASEDALISRPFIGDALPQNDVERERLRLAALDHYYYPRTFVSPDGSWGGIIIRTDFKAVPARVDDFEATGGFSDAGAFDVTSMELDSATTRHEEVPWFPTPQVEEYTEFVHALYEILDKPEYAGALELYPLGNPIGNSYFMDELMPQMFSMMLLSLALIVLIQWVLFRSLAAVLWPQAIIIISALLVVATLGWIGVRMNMMINVVMLLVVAVGVADSIHILSGYLFFRNQGEDHRQALRSTMRKSGLAVLLTSLTTGLGMLALLLVPLVPIQLFGLASALGVFFALLLSIVLLPLMLDIWAPVPKKEQRQGRLHLIQAMLRRIERWGYRRPGLNITVFAVLILVLLGGVTQVRVDSNFIKIFKEGTPIRVAQEKAEEAMGGSMALEIMVSTRTDGAMRDPRMLNALDELQQWLETELGDVVIRTRSLVDVVKDANRSLNGGRAEFFTIPQDATVLRQTLFLFSNANPQDRRRVVSDDYREAHVTVVFHNQGTRKYMKLLQTIQQHMDRQFAPLREIYPDLRITPTGGLSMIVTVIDYISWSQIQGFAMALAAISLVLLLTFRSLRVGVIALFPNLFPIIVVFGLMGYLGIAIDVDTLLVAPVMIGIVVDDTIHFLTHYRALVQQHGDIDRAIRDSFREVGQAITFTSLILAGSFITFIFLDHQGLKNFGGLASLAMLAALAGDLLLLPALLKITGTRFQPKVRLQPAEQTT